MRKREHLTGPTNGTFDRAAYFVKITTGLSVLVLASTAVAQSPANGDFFDYPATLLNGDVSAEVQLPPADCRRLCTDRRGCVGYDYFHTTNICRTFSAVTSAKVERHGVAATRALLQNYQSPLNQPPQAVISQPSPAQPFSQSRVTTTDDSQFTQYRDTKLSGFIGAKMSRGISECRSLCVERSGCAGFDYDRSGICRLFLTVTSATASVGSSAETRVPIKGN
ncbi:hypothetical protein HFO56_03240 [Rhizobium laguerreae]|uniref:PAN domain-containing protein n=1 Tax=Rhizobium laguerreae TaxID=1076926 RepID=UPI001C908A5E|nr:PAN domain-containing protein [Rhizobium laguerreae]MBY3151402.1 hypothetical protein [Rhizobium laguerreae]